MRADTEQCGFVCSECVGHCRGRQWHVRRSDTVDRRSMDAVGQCSQAAFGPGWPDKGYTNWHAVGVEARWHCDGGEVAEIDEIGEHAKAAVRTDRVGGHFGERWAKRYSRQ